MEIQKHIIPIVLAIVLMLVNQPQPTYIRQIIAWVISPIYSLIDAPYQFSRWVFEQGQDRETLVNELNQLKHENIALKAQLQTHSSTLVEVENLQKILDVNYQIGYKNTLLAMVNHINQSRFKKQLIINRGSDDGIKLGQIVIGEKGIIGRIIATTNDHSTMLSITDPTHHIPVKNKRNSIRAVAQGFASYDHKLNLNFVLKNSDIKIGDIFVTNHLLEAKLPKNHPVGKVVSTDNSDPTFMLVTLDPIEDIEQLEFVLVVMNE